MADDPGQTGVEDLHITLKKRTNNTIQL